MPPTTKIEKCSVSAARQRLTAGGFEKMDCGDVNFEIWIGRDGLPWMVPYIKGSREEVDKSAVDAILAGTPY